MSVFQGRALPHCVFVAFASSFLYNLMYCRRCRYVCSPYCRHSALGGRGLFPVVIPCSVLHRLVHWATKTRSESTQDFANSSALSRTDMQSVQMWTVIVALTASSVLAAGEASQQAICSGIKRHRQSPGAPWSTELHPFSYSSFFFCGNEIGHHLNYYTSAFAFLNCASPILLDPCLMFCCCQGPRDLSSRSCPRSRFMPFCRCVTCSRSQVPPDRVCIEPCLPLCLCTGLCSFASSPPVASICLETTAR